MKKPAYVLDSYALLAFFQAEPGGAMVKDLLREAERKKSVLFLSPINLGEIYYTIARKLGQNLARNLLEEILQLPVSLVELTLERVLDAADLKSRHPISYADAFAAALAQEMNATLVTGDPEFRRLESSTTILWL